MEYSKPIKDAIVENADQQERLNKAIYTAINAYVLIENGNGLFRGILLHFAIRKIAKLEYMLKHTVKQMHELINHIHVIP